MDKVLLAYSAQLELNIASFRKCNSNLKFVTEINLKAELRQGTPKVRVP